MLHFLKRNVLTKKCSLKKLLEKNVFQQMKN